MITTQKLFLRFSYLLTMERPVIKTEVMAIVCYRRSPYPTYGFLRPTQNLVNAYKTNENGLPYNDGKDVAESDYVDVRLDHTLARPNIPFMDVQVYDWTPREASVYGPYSPKKRLYR